MVTGIIGIAGKICAIIVKEILDFMIEKCLNKKIVMFT